MIFFYQAHPVRVSKIVSIILQLLWVLKRTISLRGDNSFEFQQHHVIGRVMYISNTVLLYELALIVMCVCDLV